MKVTVDQAFWDLFPTARITVCPCMVLKIQ